MNYNTNYVAWVCKVLVDGIRQNNNSSFMFGCICSWIELNWHIFSCTQCPTCRWERVIPSNKEGSCFELEKGSLSCSSIPWYKLSTKSLITNITKQIIHKTWFESTIPCSNIDIQTNLSLYQLVLCYITGTMQPITLFTCAILYDIIDGIAPS